MRKNETTITLLQGDKIEIYGSLSEACRNKKVSYGTLSKKKFPFKWRGVVFGKIKAREEYGIVCEK